MKRILPIFLFAFLLLIAPAIAQKELEKAPLSRLETPKTELKVEGGEAVPLRGKEAGRPLEALPGAKAITFAQWLKMDKIPETGLFLVDTDFVPYQLEEFLKKQRLTLQKDGTLIDPTGTKFALFLEMEMFKVVPKRTSLIRSAAASLRKLSPISASADPAHPYPFSMFSWYMWWRYHGGFCRDYQAGTVAEAWGPAQGGARPHTRIEYIETRVTMAGRNDRDSCFDCDYENSFVKWDIGCFWPAHGGTSGWHYANWKDGGFSATRTWSWSH